MDAILSWQRTGLIYRISQKRRLEMDELANSSPLSHMAHPIGGDDCELFAFAAVVGSSLSIM